MMCPFCCAADIEAALPPTQEGVELPPPRRSPRRPALDDLSSTDEEEDQLPAAPLRSVLTQVRCGLALCHLGSAQRLRLWFFFCRNHAAQHCLVTSVC